MLINPTKLKEVSTRLNQFLPNFLYIHIKKEKKKLDNCYLYSNYYLYSYYKYEDKIGGKKRPNKG